MTKKIPINNEFEFKQWFKENYKNLGYSKVIKDDIGVYPDFIMLRHGKEVKVELETLSSNFKSHNHNLKDVDEIVCIQKDVELGAPTIEVKNLDFIGGMVRISATIDESTLKILNSLVKGRTFRNKSHAIEKAIESLKRDKK